MLVSPGDPFSAVEEELHVAALGLHRTALALALVAVSAAPAKRPPPYLNDVLVPDGGVGGTNTIAYCRDVGPTTVVLRAVDTSGNRSGPSNELNITC